MATGRGQYVRGVGSVAPTPAKAPAPALVSSGAGRGYFVPQTPVAPVAPTAPTSPVATTPREIAPALPNETPSKTYERITGKTWTGGFSPEIQAMYKQYGITAPAGSAEANLALQKALNTPVAPVAPIAEPATPAKVEPTPTEVPTEPAPPTDIAQSDTSTAFDDIFAQLGITTQNTIEDVVKTVAKLYGYDDINKEMEGLDNQFADDVASINDNPWLSEGLRRKKISGIQDKYDSKKNALIQRLSLQDNIIGRALTLYNQEKNYQQDLMFKAIDLRQKEIDRQSQVESDEWDRMLDIEKLEIDREKELYNRTQDKSQLEQNMIGKGYNYVKTPAERDALKAQGYDIIELNGRTYSKPGKLSKVTYKGVTTWYDEMGNKVKTDSGGGGGNTSTTNTLNSAINEMTSAINSVTGADGYVSPDDYRTLKKQWIDSGLYVADFNKKFEVYKNPRNYNY